MIHPYPITKKKIFEELVDPIRNSISLPCNEGKLKQLIWTLPLLYKTIFFCISRTRQTAVILRLIHAPGIRSTVFMVANRGLHSSRSDLFPRRSFIHRARILLGRAKHHLVLDKCNTYTHKINLNFWTFIVSGKGYFHYTYNTSTLVCPFQILNLS